MQHKDFYYNSMNDDDKFRYDLRRIALNKKTFTKSDSHKLIVRSTIIIEEKPTVLYLLLLIG